MHKKQGTSPLPLIRSFLFLILIAHLLYASVVLLFYLVEPPPQDYITKRKTKKKSQNSNEVKNGCTPSRVRIDAVVIIIFCYDFKFNSILEH